MRSQFAEDTTVADIDRRLSAVERAARLPNSSIDSGTLLVQDGGGIGVVGGDGTYRRWTAEIPVGAGVWIEADWDDDPVAANGYRVELAEAAVGLINTLPTDLSSVRLVGLKPATGYTVTVYSVTAAGFTGSSAATITTGADATIPGAPTGLDVWGGLGSLIASWDAVPDTDVTVGGSYQLQVAANAAFTENRQQFTVAGRVLSVTALAAQLWYVRVRAVDTSGNVGPWSATDTATVLAAAGGGRDFLANPIQSTEIADDAVTTPKLAANAVVAGTIAADAITGNEIAAGSITGADAVFATAAISSADIGSLSAAKITTGSLVAAIITLAAGGALRAGTVAAPFNYLTLSQAGLSFYSAGTAAYTGGTRRLLMDVATGNIEILGNLTVGGPGNPNTSLRVLNSAGDTVLDADENDVGISDLKVDYLTVGAQRFGVLDLPRAYTVNPNTGNDQNTGSTFAPLRTIGEALRRLPKNINSTVYISVVAGTRVYEDVKVLSFAGAGTILIQSTSDSVHAEIYGSVVVQGCTLREVKFTRALRIIDSGATSVEKTSAQWLPDEYPAEYPGTVTVVASRYVTLEGVSTNVGLDVISEGRRRFSIWAGFGSEVYCRFTYTVGAGDASIAAWRHARVQCLETEGRAAPGTLAFWAVQEARIRTDGVAPEHTGSLVAYENQGGQVTGNLAGSPSTATPPPPAPTRETRMWAAYKGNSWRPGGFRNDDIVRQGTYGFGDHKGYWYWNNTADIRAALAGKTIYRVELVVTRIAQGGVTGKQTIHFYEHNDTVEPAGTPGFGAFLADGSFAWGEELHVGLPPVFGERLRDNTVKGVGIQGAPYALMVGGATLRISFGTA